MVFLDCGCSDDKFCLCRFCLFLDHTFDTYLMISEYFRDCCQYSRFITHLHTDKETILDIRKFLDRKLFVCAPSDSSGTVPYNISCNIHHISDNCTCGRQFSCSSSIEHGTPNCISVYKNSIKGISYGSERMFLIDHHRINTCFNSIRCISRNTDQFDHISHLFCVIYICCCDLCDSLRIDIRKFHLRMEC